MDLIFQVEREKNSKGILIMVNVWRKVPEKTHRWVPDTGYCIQENLQIRLIFKQI